MLVIGGNITRDLELKYTPSGIACLDFSIANNHVWFNDAGEKKEDVCFVECRIWGKPAETVAANFQKGAAIVVEGRLAQERWEDNVTGKARSKTLIRVTKWHFGSRAAKTGPRDDDEGSQTAARGSQRPHSPPTARSYTPTTNRPPPPGNTASRFHDEDGPITDGIEGDDIPF